jgi:hypothetical protein
LIVFSNERRRFFLEMIFDWGGTCACWLAHHPVPWEKHGIARRNIAWFSSRSRAGGIGLSSPAVERLRALHRARDSRTDSPARWKSEAH